MKITIIGTGYVGLVTGACLAEVGNDVLCLDVDAAQDRACSNAAACRSTSPASSRWSRAQRRRRAASRFTTDVDAAVAHGALQFIAVGTPPDEDGSADLQYVLAAARSIGRHMSGYKVVVDKSHGAGRHRRQGARGDRRGARRRAASTFAFASSRTRSS